MGNKVKNEKYIYQYYITTEREYKNDELVVRVGCKKVKVIETDKVYTVVREKINDNEWNGFTFYRDRINKNDYLNKTTIANSYHRELVYITEEDTKEHRQKFWEDVVKDQKEQVKRIEEELKEAKIELEKINKCEEWVKQIK